MIQKRGAIFLGLLLVLSLTFVSAGFFDKLTGKVILDNGQAACVSGCLDSEGACHELGYVMDKKYCDIETKNFILQKGSGKFCNNDFECSTGRCADSKCTTEGVLSKIIDWLNGIFKGGDEEKEKDVKDYGNKNLCLELGGSGCTDTIGTGEIAMGNFHSQTWEYCKSISERYDNCVKCDKENGYNWNEEEYNCVLEDEDLDDLEKEDEEENVEGIDAVYIDVWVYDGEVFRETKSDRLREPLDYAKYDNLQMNCGGVCVQSKTYPISEGDTAQFRYYSVQNVETDVASDTSVIEYVIYRYKRGTALGCSQGYTLNKATNKCDVISEKYVSKTGCDDYGTCTIVGDEILKIGEYYFRAKDIDVNNKKVDFQVQGPYSNIWTIAHASFGSSWGLPISYYFGVAEKRNLLEGPTYEKVMSITVRSLEEGAVKFTQIGFVEPEKTETPALEKIELKTGCDEYGTCTIVGNDILGIGDSFYQVKSISGNQVTFGVQGPNTNIWTTQRHSVITEDRENSNGISLRGVIPATSSSSAIVSFTVR